MQDKHKVTLYLPQDVHRQLKISSAVTSEPMSAIAERAIAFYLSHPAVVDEVDSVHGGVHRIYSCPECSESMVLRNGEMVSIVHQPGVLMEEELSNRVQTTRLASTSNPNSQESVDEGVEVDEPLVLAR